MKDIMIATGNLNKVREYKEMLEPLGYTVHDLREIEHVDPEETGTTFAENALIKARSVYKTTGMTTISDDSGLSITALNGAPGIYSARYLNTDDYDYKNDYILNELKDASDRSAWYTCAIAFIDAKGKEYVFEGEMRGEIAKEKAGNNGFGYDPIFYLPSIGKTCAEISPEEKNAISHRGKATKLLLEFLAENSKDEN